MKAWFTAAELEELKLPGLPGTRRNITETAKRESWRKQQRAGRGGGWEYPLDALPEASRIEIMRRETATALPAPAATRAIATVITADLRDYQAGPMKARQIILDYIAGQVLTLNVSRLRAEETFCAMAAAGELPAHLQRAAIDANARGGLRRTVSPASLRRWRAEYERGGAAALAVKAAPERTEPMEWLLPFMKLYSIPSKPTVAGAYYRLQQTQPEISLPDLRSVQRYIAGLDAITKNRGRFGPREMKRFRAFKSRDFSMLEPGWVYSADGHKADLEVISPETGQAVRPEIVTVIDIATRRAVGWYAGNHESALLVGAALVNACHVAIPAIFYVDNGAGFKNDYMSNPDHGLLGTLGITMVNSLPYNSQARGVIERFHQTWVRAAKFKPSFMGTDMDAEAKNIVFKRSRKDLQVAGATKYLMTWVEFLEWAQSEINAYNDRPHDSFPKIRDPQTYALRHPSPNEVWASFADRGFVPELPDQSAIDDARRPYEYRVVQRGTVNVLGAKYFHERLDAEGWHGRRVLVGYDLRASDKVWVRAEDGRLICIARLNGNQIDYMPKSVIARAIERRQDAQIRNTERKLEELRIERDGEQPAIGYTVIDGDLTAEQEAKADAQIAAIELPALPAPSAEPTETRSERPVFMNDAAWVEWVKAGNGDEDDRALLLKRMESPTFCELYDLPYPVKPGTAQEADLRAAG